MGCKSCKKNKGTNIIKSIIDVKNGISNGVETKDNIKGDHELFNYEKLLLTIFGWGPLVVGYYHIVRFITNLF
jgi:hypothetical protein|tara:strand:- start:876 stop:1094 length:219 start_codon:yes stop_codon:yes gene_type:complete